MATITSTQTGNWHDTSTWVGGAVPVADDLVVIAHGHRVTVSTNIQSAKTGDITIDGNLHFATGGKMHLDGRMTVNNSSNDNTTAGEFVEGTSTSGSLLSMANGTEIKISGDNSAQHGIQVNSRRWCGVQIDGSEPTLKTELNGNHDYESTYLTVDNSANFTAGDLISIYRREEDFRLVNDEVVYVHDVDTTNHRIYFRQFISPIAEFNKPIITAVSGSTITVDDASVYRVNYKLIFGTGDNRNVKTITAINKFTNVITLDSSVDNDPSLIGEYVYQTGTEKYHLNDSHVRRTASAATNIIGAIDDLPIFSTQAEAEAWGASKGISGSHTHTYNGVTTYMAGTTHADIQASGYSGGRGVRDVKVNNAADFSVGDKIYIEACGDSSYAYTSGSETNGWRHNLVYTISAINSLTITVDRDILYDMKPGGLVAKMSRDVVIKACQTDGTDVPITTSGNDHQNTARVFFNVKYWTSNSATNAPTRRVKIKYVEFDGLGYNTNDSTNFRAGVNIAGYNGYYDTKITGSAADNSTIHSTSGVSQTGENYLDGCTYTAYNLVTNEVRDGDSYPSICSRHPYGMVFRNLLVVGSGRGVWHWSSQYFIKSHGHISAACNYSSLSMDSAYEYPNEYSYMYLRMAEDYGFIYNHLGRQNDNTTIQHFDVQYQWSYCVHHGYASNPTWRRIYMDKYRYTYIPDSVQQMAFQDSRFMPNYWDASTYIYNPNASHTPYYDPDEIRHYNSGNNYPYRSTASNNRKIYWLEHGFREEEYVEMSGGITKLQRKDQAAADFIVSRDPGQIMSRIFVPANTVVNLKSTVRVNDANYDKVADTIDDNSYPVLVARGRRNSGFGGRHHAGVVTDNDVSIRTLNTSWDFIADANDRAGVLNSTQAQGKAMYSFLEYATHTSASQGAYETKTITVAAQRTGYELAYGFYIDNSDIRDTGFKALPIQVLMSRPGVVGSAHLHNGTIGRLSIRTGFNDNKKRISGRI